jgi:competence protein ComEC
MRSVLLLVVVGCAAPSGGMASPPGDAAAPSSEDAGGTAVDAGKPRVAMDNRLRIYWVDVEGGGATFLVAPTGEIILNDAGWAENGRDAARIEALLRSEIGGDHIDYLIASHYHPDHMGGLPALASRVPIRQFLDHGPPVEAGDYASYVAGVGGGKRTAVVPGQVLQIGELQLQFVVSAGNALTAEAAANPLCAGAMVKTDVPDEDPQSVGYVARFGRFKYGAFGDVTWGVEHRLACPGNVVGNVDLFQVTQHGSDESNAPQLVHALAPVVAVINCGPYKGNATRAFEVVKTSPGLEAIWQVHRTLANDLQHNAEEPFIANLVSSTAAEDGRWLSATATADGTFIITNSRTGQSRTYHAR